MNYVVTDPLSKGFTKPTAILGICVYRINEIEDPTVKGLVTKKDIEEIRSRVSMFFQRRFKIFEYLMNWLIFNKVESTIPADGKNNNYNLLQDAKDVERSLHANCVDVSTLVHTVANVLRVKHYIVWVKFNNLRTYESAGHLFVVYRPRGKEWRIFRYVPVMGDIIQCGDSVEDAVKSEILELKPHFVELFGPDIISLYMLIGPEEFKIWDKYVKEKQVQKELLNALDHYGEWHSFNH
jgi:hypothetical protein